MYFRSFDATDKVYINGAAGNETFSLPQGISLNIDMKGGADTVNASYYGSDTRILGGTGNDRIAYGDGVTLDGGADNDTLFVGTGYLYSGTNIFNLASTSDQSIGDGATVTSFENIDWSGSPYAVSVTGSSGANTIKGSDSGDPDTLDGAGGSDSVSGGGGSDRIWYDGADTIIDGGAGSDTLLLRGAATIDLNTGSSDQATGAGDTGLTTNFENVDAGGSTVAVKVTGRDDLYSNLLGGSAGGHDHGGRLWCKYRRSGRRRHSGR